MITGTSSSNIAGSGPDGTGSGTDGAVYVKAPYLQVQSRGGSDYLVVNILTKKQYQLSEAALSMLDRLAAPCTVDDLREAFPEEDADTVDDFLDYLRIEELIVPAGAAGLNRKPRMARRNVNLFDLPDFISEDRQPGIVVAGIPFGRGNAIPNNTHRTPQVLRTYAASLNMGIGTGLDPLHLSGLYGREIVWDTLMANAAERRLADWGDLFIFGHENVDVVYEKIRAMAGMLFRDGHAPMFIGGDHSISFPLIDACARHHPGLHVIHMDAHTDTYHHRLDAYYDDIATHHHGNFAARCMALDGVAAFHQFGIRGANNLTHRSAGAKQHIHYIGETREAASGVTTSGPPPGAPCYVTLDIDVLDPSEAPGTCTPMPGGLRYTELIGLLDLMLRDRSVVGADIVEIDVERDVNRVTTHIGVELALLLLNYLRPGC